MEKPLKPLKKKKEPPGKIFHVSIPVKSYVKRFLELNYGDPVFFHPDREDYSVLRECLKDSRRYDSKYDDVLCTYSNNVTVLLTEYDFYHFGWDMTRTNVIKFGVHFETKVKTLMRSMVGIYHGLGLPINVSINKFQDRFFFDENVWQYQSIKKDFYRNGTTSKIDFDGEIFNKVEKIVVKNLYKKGTISHTFIKDYENDQ